MANFYLDTPDLVAMVDRLDLSEVVSLLERGYTEHGEYDVAPTSYEEAMDGYKAALELVGDLSASVIAGLSASIDSEVRRWSMASPVRARLRRGISSAGRGWDGGCNPAKAIRRAQLPRHCVRHDDRNGLQG